MERMGLSLLERARAGMCKCSWQLAIFSNRKAAARSNNGYSVLEFPPRTSLAVLAAPIVHLMFPWRMMYIQHIPIHVYDPDAVHPRMIQVHLYVQIVRSISVFLQERSLPYSVYIMYEYNASI